MTSRFGDVGGDVGNGLEIALRAATMRLRKVYRYKTVAGNIRYKIDALLAFIFPLFSSN